MARQEIEPSHGVIELTRFVAAVRPDPDVLRARVLVICGEDRRWRRDRVLEPDREQRRDGRSGGEMSAIEVVERPEHALLGPLLRAQEVADLAIRHLVGDLERPAIVAQERDVDRRGPEPIGQRGDRQRQPTALAASGDGNPIRIDHRMGARRIDGQHGVGHEPAVVVRGRVEDAAGHHARVLGPGPRRLDVGRVPRLPLRALAPGVHDEVRIPGRGPEQPAPCPPASAAIAEVLDHRGQRALDSRRPHEPGPDRLPRVTGERHVRGADGSQAIVHGPELGR